jgi:hypothetical protein
MVLAACWAIPFSAESLAAQRAARPLSPRPAELMIVARLRSPGQPLAAPAISGLQVVVSRPSRRQGETLMIIGGAVLLTGLLVNEALISITGVAIGGYGLYVYLNASPRRK